MKKGFFKRIFLTLLMLLCWISIIVCIAAYSFLTTTWGAKIAATFLIETRFPFCSIQIGEYKGTIEKGLSLKNVDITNIPDLKNAALHIQELFIQIPLIEWNKMSLRFIDARVLLKDADPIIFNGTIANHQLKGTCFAHSLDARQVLLTLGYEDLGKAIYGFISHVEFDLSGEVTSPHFNGHFFVDRFICNGTELKDGFGHLDIVIQSLGNDPHIKGDIFLESALVVTHKINIDLSTSKVAFSGDVTNPSLDIHGSNKVEDILIDMAIKGTLQRPIFLFSSDPPMSQDEILTALFTGKSWTELGQDEASAIGLRKKLNDAFNVGMEFKEMPSQIGQAKTEGYLRTIEGQMKLTDKLSFNVAQKYYPQGETISNAGNSNKALRNNDTELLLEYKKRF